MVHAVARHMAGTGERLATVAAQVVGLVGHGTFVVGVLVAGQPLSKTKNQSWSEKQPLTRKNQEGPKQLSEKQSIVKNT